MRTTQITILLSADIPLCRSLTTFINKSPLAEGKKQLAVKQAGDYDAAATRAQIDSLVNDNGVGALLRR